MPVSAPERLSGGAPEGSRMMNRIARPLNGVEVAEAVLSQLKDLGSKLLKEEAIKGERGDFVLNNFVLDIQYRTSTNYLLSKINIRYPKVGWICRVRLERLDDAGLDYSLNGEADIDLEAGRRLCLQFGTSGLGFLVNKLEDETLSTDQPDRVRQDLGLPIELEFIKPNGEVGKTTLEEIEAKQPKRAARSVEVGRGIEGGTQVEIREDNENTFPVLANARVSTEIVTELPEVSLDLDIPIVEAPPPPAPPGGLGQSSKPKSYYKGRK